MLATISAVSKKYLQGPMPQIKEFLVAVSQTVQCISEVVNQFEFLLQSCKNLQESLSYDEEVTRDRSSPNHNPNPKHNSDFEVKTWDDLVGDNLVTNLGAQSAAVGGYLRRMEKSEAEAEEELLDARAAEAELQKNLKLLDMLRLAGPDAENVDDVSASLMAKRRAAKIKMAERRALNVIQAGAREDDPVEWSIPICCTSNRLGAYTMIGDAKEQGLIDTLQGTTQPVRVVAAEGADVTTLSISRSQLRKVELVGIIDFFNTVPAFKAFHRNAIMKMAQSAMKHVLRHGEYLFKVILQP